MARLGKKALTPHLLDLVDGVFEKAKDTFDAAYTRYSCRDVKVKHNLERLFNCVTCRATVPFGSGSTPWNSA